VKWGETKLEREIVMLKQTLSAVVLSAALALMVASTARAAACKRGEPRCGVPLQKACTDPESGVEFPKGYMCVNDPNKWGWQCEIHDGEFKFYKTKGSGGKRKRDAIFSGVVNGLVGAVDC
jgi:hypothetical protein